MLDLACSLKCKIITTIKSDVFYWKLTARNITKISKKYAHKKVTVGATNVPKILKL